MMEQVDGKMMGNMLENDDKAHDKAVDLGYLQSWTKLDALGQVDPQCRNKLWDPMLVLGREPIALAKDYQSMAMLKGKTQPSQSQSVGFRLRDLIWIEKKLRDSDGVIF